jgi:mRNA interferase MazF
MGAFVKGDVVVAPFPFSDLSAAKKRPAFVVATPTGDDVIRCQITGQTVSDNYALPLTDRDFTSGGLSILSPSWATSVSTRNCAQRIYVER